MNAHSSTDVMVLFKHPDIECYGLEVDGVSYIPVMASVYEGGTSRPDLLARREITTGYHGFWTRGQIPDDWEWLDLEDVDCPHWVKFLKITAELLK